MSDKLTIDYRYFNPTSQYQVIPYSAGELQMRIQPELVESVELADEITVLARLSAPIDGYPSSYTLHSNLAGLVLLSDAIHGINPKAKQILHLPYLPYSRADRRFVDGDCHGLATFGKMLEAGEFQEVVTLDVHNYSKAHMFIRGLVNIVPKAQILAALMDFEEFALEKPAILFPDAGAVRRYRKLGCVPDGYATYHAEKHRDPATGKFLEFRIPDIKTMLDNHGSILIVDDLCDAGGTFIGIAELLRKAGNPMAFLGLYTTHGIYPNGLTPLCGFNRVYSTDSVKRSNLIYDGFRFTRYDSYEALTDPANTRMDNEI